MAAHCRLSERPFTTTATLYRACAACTRVSIHSMHYAGSPGHGGRVPLSGAVFAEPLQSLGWRQEKGEAVGAYEARRTHVYLPVYSEYTDEELNVLCRAAGEVFEEMGRDRS